MLKLSTDRKTAPSCKWEPGKKRWVPIVSNAFGLTPGSQGSCAGAETPTCAGPCYAKAASAGHRPQVRKLLDDNLSELRAMGDEEMVEALHLLILEFEIQCRKAKLTESDWIFRIHWSGEFFSRAYGIAWVAVAAMHPKVHFWTYTRHPWVLALPWPDNATVYASADPDNRDRMVEAAEVNDRPVAWMMPTGELQPRPEARTILCPVYRTPNPMLLVSDDGKGACSACRLCLKGNADIVFPIHVGSNKARVSIRRK